MAKITFINPGNAYNEIYDTAASPLWCLIFGSFYWLARGNLAHALLSFGLAIVTCGVSWFVYPLFANRINIRNYQRRGWILKESGTRPVKDIRRVKLEDAKAAPSPIFNYRNHRLYKPVREWYWRNWKWTVPAGIIVLIINCLVWPDMIRNLMK